LILIVTLVPGSWIETPVGDPPRKLNLGFSLSDFMANWLLFVPFGVSVGRASGSTRRALTYSFLLSAVVEIAQLGMPYRYSNPFDVVSNTAGGITGALLWSSSRRWRALTDQEAAWSCALLAGLLASGVLISNLLLLPAPPTGPYFVHAPPQIGGFEPLPGEILDVALDGTPLTRNAVANSKPIRTALTGDFELRIRARLNVRPTKPSLIFMITAKPDKELALLLRIEGDDLVVRYRAQSSQIRLEEIDFRADGLLRSLQPQQPFEVVVRRQGRRTCVELDSRAYCKGDLGISELWALYLPQLERLLGRLPLVSFLWVGTWGLAIGVLTRRHWSSAAGIGLLVTTLWITSQLGPLQPLSYGGILVGLLGFGIGLVTRRLFFSA
jgi:hypothetical protein